jgi:hypothetical protein
LLQWLQLFLSWLGLFRWLRLLRRLLAALESELHPPPALI